MRIVPILSNSCCALTLNGSKKLTSWHLWHHKSDCGNNNPTCSSALLSFCTTGSVSVCMSSPSPFCFSIREAPDTLKMPWMLTRTLTFTLELSPSGWGTTFCTEKKPGSRWKEEDLNMFLWQETGSCIEKKKKISHLRKHTHPPHGDTHTVQIIMMFGWVTREPASLTPNCHSICWASYLAHLH